MPNYYEMLKIAPTAETAEIEAVLDAQYEQWSNLVTHQDPKLQLQAQQALPASEPGAGRHHLRRAGAAPTNLQ